MRISGIGGQMSPIGGMQAMDQESKNLQNQISQKQKQLQELSSNEEMSVEEKMKKRQEIQKEITDLNSQLRQHQMEQRKEKQQEKGASMDDMLGGNRKPETLKGGTNGTKSAGLSQANMKAMMTADSAMSQAKVQGSVASEMNGRAGVLEVEIKLDAARGGNVEQKQEELADVQVKAEKAAASQISDLAEANKSMEQASKETGKTENTEEREEPDKAKEEQETKVPESPEEDVQPEVYTPIDIRL